MELKSFRELLIKKAANNPHLQTLIKYAKDDLITDSIIELLIKMAEPSAAMGRGANSALTSYAGQMTNSDVEQLRDALGHHISHYKGALKTHHTAQDPAVKQQARSAADQHLNKIVPYMHLAGRAGKHSGGKMVLDYRSTTPWETNYTTADRHDHNKKLKEGTKDLGRRPKASRDKEIPVEQRTNEHRGVPNYRYLEMAPHQGHADTKRLPMAESGYPFEEIQLGSPDKRDAGQAYLPLEDIKDPVTSFVPHPFDQHPVHRHADDNHFEGRDDATKQKYADDLKNWRSSPHHQKWLADQKAKYNADPEAYKKRGTSKPDHFFKDIPLHPQPKHATKEANANVTPIADEADDVQEAPVASAAPAQATPAKAPSKAENKSNDEQHLAAIRSTFTPEQIKKLTPDMKRILGFKD